MQQAEYKRDKQYGIFEQLGSRLMQQLYFFRSVACDSTGKRYFDIVFSGCLPIFLNN
jgi:hypothetical protein